MFNTNNLIKHQEVNTLVENKMSFVYEGKDFLVEDSAPGSEYLFAFKHEANGGFERVFGIGDAKKGIIIPMTPATLKVLQEQGLFFTPKPFESAIEIRFSNNFIAFARTQKEDCLTLFNKVRFFAKGKEEQIKKAKKAYDEGAIRKEKTEEWVTYKVDLDFTKKIVLGGLRLGEALIEKAISIYSIVKSFDGMDISFLKEADKRDKDLK